ncbi:MAG: sirohydrochlorin chelatase [Cyanobacteria bacterium P01_G01_bin.19]
MTIHSAYFLVIHGSRNRKTLFAAARLQEILAAKIASKLGNLVVPFGKERGLDFSSSKVKILDAPRVPLLETAALELAPLPLNQSLVDFASKAYAQGYGRVKVLPLFLAPGVHVIEDIPSEISLAVEQIGDQITIELSPFIGKYSAMEQLIIDKFSTLSGQSRILMAHGSRLPAVREYCTRLANKVEASVAYWSKNPSLQEQVAIQVARGSKKIAILPYFLFPGRITETIALEVASLQAKYPEVELVLGQPLGTTKAIAELIAQKI